MTIDFGTQYEGHVYIYEIMPGGGRHDIWDGYLSAGSYTLGTYAVQPPAGLTTLWIELSSYYDVWTDHCQYIVQAPAPAVDIWTEPKSCGSTYCIGDYIEIWFSLNTCMDVELYKTTAWGTQLLWSGSRCAGNYYATGTVGEPTGTHTFTVYGYSDHQQDSDSCSIYVQRCTAPTHTPTVTPWSTRTPTRTPTITPWPTRTPTPTPTSTQVPCDCFCPPPSYVQK